MQKDIKIIKNILNKKDKNKYNFYFVGIGGVSMFSLAVYLKKLNMEVSGTDARVSNNTKTLQKMGIKVNTKHNSQNIEGANFVVYSYAVEDSLEVKKAQELNICTISRAQLLGLILKTYKTPICIAGAHGKSTTTALIYHILKCAGLCPNLHLGATLTESGTSFNYAQFNYDKKGKQKNANLIRNSNKLLQCKNSSKNLQNNNQNFFVCEACEYKNAFLNFKPSVAVILNIAPEHLDFFKTFNNVKKSFNKFAKSAKVLICESGQKICHPNKITFGLTSGDFYASNICINNDGTHNFDVIKKGKFFCKISTTLVGQHNIKNVLASIAVADYVGVSKNNIINGIKTFKGICRRFEIMRQNKFIIHDYAHHPEEIDAVLKSVRSFFNGRVLVVFQPHTYSRTLALKSQFKTALQAADEVLVYRTYSARESYIKQGSAKALCNLLNNAKYCNSAAQVKNIVIEKSKQNWAILFLGAGSIYGIAKNIAKLC